MPGEAAGTHRVVFTPSGLEAAVADGTTVLDAARSVGVDLDSTCGGRGLCGRCQIVPTTGSFAKWQIDALPEALTEWSTTEAEYSGRRPIAAGQRLGCAARVVGDAIVEVPPDSQVHRPVIRKSVNLDGLQIDPLVHLYYLEIADPGDSIEDVQPQIIAALAGQFEVYPTSVAATVAPLLVSTCHEQGGSITVAVRRGKQICWIAAGYSDRVVGIAVDVGSTTIAGHLVDLGTGEVLASHGVMNPQIRFGDDLMSRVSYVMMNPGGERELTAVVRGALREMIDTLTDDAGFDRGAVMDMVIVGNPIMHHLVLGLDPTPLGQAPFPLATDGAVTTTATELDLDAPFAEVYLLPCIAGHVGADTAAAILAEGPHRHDAIQLLVDVGTNAEIVFGNSSSLLAASSPTGPAFEGAQIAAGQRAIPGAIERVRIDRVTLEPRVRVIGSSAWSDDPDFAARAAAVGVTGMCGSGIIEAIGEMFLSGIIAADGTIRGDHPTGSDRIVPDGRTFSYLLHSSDAGDVYVTQDDVRAIQLAKAALRAGIDLLVQHLGVTPDEIGSVRLAGAFGAHIDPLYAKVLGLIPDVPVDRVRAVGNAAGAGAVRALLSASQRTEVEATVATVTKIETALEPRFQELFVDAMGFPHSSRATPNLASETPLPDATPTSATRATRGRRRRRP